MKKTIKNNLLIAGLCLAMTACMTGYAVTAMAETTEETTRETPSEKPKDDGSILAKITAIDGSTITVVTAEQPAGGQKGQGMPRQKPADGETPPELPEGETPPEPAEGKTPPEPAEGKTPPELPNGETPPELPKGETRKEMSFTEETSTWTISSSVVIKKGREGESASLSDLAEGTIIRAILDGDTVVSIEVMDADFMGDHRQPQNNDLS